MARTQDFSASASTGGGRRESDLTKERVLPTLREKGEGERSTRKVVDEQWDDLLHGLDLHSYIHSEGSKKAFVEGTKFNVGMGVVIFLNVLVIGLDTDVNSNADAKPHIVWPIMYNTFCVIWVSEALIKLWFYRCKYFKSGWNLIDFFLVFLTLFDAWWIQPNFKTAKDISYFGFSLYRMVRIGKLLRFLRLLRVMRLIQEVWLITEGFMDALKTLTWVFILLFLAIYCGSIYMTTIVGQTCTTDYKGTEFETTGECDEFYGKVPGSAVSLFQVLTLDAWAERLARPVLAVKPHLILFFVPFLFVTTYGVLNIVIGVVVENTLNVTKNNKTLQRQRAQTWLHQELELLRHIFEEADENHNGTMEREELRNILRRPDVQEVFHALELPYHEVDTLFDIFDVEKTGELTIHAFVNGALRHKGAPPGFDIRSMSVGLKGIARRIDRMDVALEKLLKSLADDRTSNSNQPSLQTDDVCSGQDAGLHRSGTAGSLRSQSSTGTPKSQRRVQLVTNSTAPKEHQPSMRNSDPSAVEDIHTRLFTMEQSIQEVKQDQSTFVGATKELRELLEAIATNLGVSEEPQGQIFVPQKTGQRGASSVHSSQRSLRDDVSVPSSLAVESVRILSDVATRNESIEQDLAQQAELLRKAGKVLNSKSQPSPA